MDPFPGCVSNALYHIIVDDAHELDILLIAVEEVVEFHEIAEFVNQGLVGTLPEFIPKRIESLSKRP